MIVPQARKETFLFYHPTTDFSFLCIDLVFVSSRQRLLHRPCPEASLKEYRASTPCVSFSKEPGNNYFRFCQVLTMSMRSFSASCPLICPTRCLSSSSNPFQLITNIIEALNSMRLPTVEPGSRLKLIEAKLRFKFYFYF